LSALRTIFSSLERALGLAASAISVTNLFYPAFAGKSFGSLAFPSQISISATVGFYSFLFAQACSAFFVAKILTWTSRNYRSIGIAAVFLGIANAAITIFDFQFFFNIQSLDSFSKIMGLVVCTGISLFLDVFMMSELSGNIDTTTKYASVQSLVYIGSVIFFTRISGVF